jgi:signal transduction histidine kinase/DNA-binding response OmpR family regulator
MAESDKVSILVVDDLPEKLLVYDSILAELNENIVTARSGAEALKAVLKHNFAVILLDVNMPDMDGFETAQLIRKRAKSAHTPIIFVTSYFDDVRTHKGYAYGAVDYIMAPVEPEILRAKVKVFIDLFRMHQQVEARAEERVLLAEEQAKRLAAEQANHHFAFLAKASGVLANSLDLNATLRGLTKLVVPFLSDLCVVSLADESHNPYRTDWAWKEGSGELCSASESKWPVVSSELTVALERVLTTRTKELLPDLNERWAGPDNPNGEDPNFPAFTLNSAVVLPLTARDKILGCLAFAYGPSERQYNQSNLSLMEDLASRAGIALDNAMLVRNIQEADRHKDEFLATLAHELRNPLAPIRNSLHMLHLADARTDVGKLHETMERQVNHMVRLVDDLLEVSRITRGKIDLRKEVVDLASVVRSAVETSKPYLDAAKHVLTVSIPEEPIYLEADSVRLAQVISNLLNNAAKYTDAGGQIHLSAERVGDAVRVVLRDNGVGIPAEMLPKVFNIFTQIDRTLGRSQGGLGIGLTIVKRLVEMHAGRVEVFSDGEGRGSEFVVTLPLAKRAPVVQPVTPPPQVQPPKEDQRILVVDDNRDAADSLGALLEFLSARVRVEYNGASALAALDAFKPDIIFLDIGMPGMDGYEVARRIRQAEAHKCVRLIALTGWGQSEDLRRSRDAGFDLHLVKPIEFHTLQSLIHDQSIQTNGASKRAVRTS